MSQMHPNNDRPRSSVIDLVRRWRVLVGVVTLAAVLGGAFLGSRAVVEETAEARLVISATNASPEALPGVTQASMTLAGMYARLVTVDPVLGPVAEQVGAPLVELRDDVIGSPLPESAIVRVIVTAPTAGEAMQTADLVVESLVAYDRSESARNTVDESVALASYDEAAQQLLTAELAALRARTALDGLTTAAAADPSGAVADPEAVALNEAALVAAQVQVDRANLLLGVFGDAYRSAVATEQVSLLRSLGPASATGSTPSDVRAGAFGGLVVGLGVATALAHLLDRRRRPRAGLPTPNVQSSNGARDLATSR